MPRDQYVVSHSACDECRPKRRFLYGLIFLLICVQTASAWWNTSWHRRRILEIDNGFIGTQQDSIAILVKLCNSRIDYSACRTGGADLRFVDADDATMLAHEIEQWTEGGTSYVWVRVPDIKATGTSDSIFMYYDNPGAADGQNADGTWNGDYIGVWHFTGTDTFHDVSGNGNHAAVIDGPIPADSAGLSGGPARYLEKTATESTNVEIADDPSLDLLAAEMTIMAVVKKVNTLGDWNMVATRYTGTGDEDAWVLGYHNNANDSMAWACSTDVSTNKRVSSEPTTGDDGIWRLYTGTYDGTDLKLYQDAVLVRTKGQTGDIISSDKPMYIGCGENNGVINEHADIIIDELRISKKAGSALFIEVQDSSQRDNLLTFNSEQTSGVSASWWNASWTRRSVLNIDNGFVSSRLDSFTALVKLWSGRINYNHTRDAGQDIRFIDADGAVQLNYEIEEWNESGTSYVWVRIPDIKATGTPDSIFVYYGNTAAPDDQDADNAWNDDYIGVWHFTGPDTFLDVSGYDNHAAITAGPSLADSAGITGGPARYFKKTATESTNVEVADDASLDLLSAEMTVTAVVKKVNTLTGWNLIATRYTGAGNDDVWFLGYAYAADDSLIFACSTSTPQKLQAMTDETTGDDGIWRHYTGTFDGSNIALYQDGVLVRSTGLTGDIIPSDKPMYIGGGVNNGVFNEHADIIIDELRISKKAGSALFAEAQDSSIRDNLFSFGTKDSVSASGTWWNSAWRRRIKLKFDNAFLSEQQDSFPILVKLTPGRMDYSKCRTAGRDIRFVDADNSTSLSYEIEEWDEGGASYVWVRVPDIKTSGTADSIWMYYDNPTAVDAQAGSAVWNADFAAVWHLNETSNTDADGFRDATSNGNHGQGFNFDGDERETGMAGGGLRFNGSDEYINCGSDASLDLGPASDITLMAWVKPDSVHHGKLICKNTSSTDKEYDLSLNSSGGIGFEMEDDGNNGDVNTEDSVQAAGVWLLAAATFVNSTLEVRFYGDGTEMDTMASGNPIDDLPDLTNADVELGRRHYDSSCFLDGVLDEVRILSRECSAEWMKTQFKSMADSLIDWSASAEQTNGVSESWWHDSWTRRRTLNIDNGFVDTQQDSFTALVKLWNQRIDYNNTQGAGQDLRFLDADLNSQLNYEIEKWDESGTSYVWVQLEDILATGTADSIFMYYGNGTVTDDQDTTNTWSSEYAAVYHLGDDIRDHSGNGNHLSNNNATTVTGLIGGAYEFDSSTDMLWAPSDPSLEGFDEITLVALAYRTGAASAGASRLISKTDAATGDDYALRVNDVANNYINGRITDAGGQVNESTNGSMPLNTWSFGAMKWSDAGEKIKVYLDGAEDSQTAGGADQEGPMTDADDSLGIGNHPHDPGGTRYFTGYIDEVAILSEMMPDIWIEAQDSSMRDNLFDFGAETVLEEDTTGVGATWWNAAWRRRVKLKFDNSYLGSQQDSIPILVTLTPDRMDYSKCRTEGRDIRFVDADNSTSLSFEIEEWDEGGGSYVWVRVPDIKASGTADSIWMYYDNPTAVDAQADSAVWNGDFAAVWHLNEEGNTGADGFQDATSNRNHGQGFNFDGDEREAGMAGGGLRFNGSDEYINCGSDASLDLGPTSDITLMAWVKPDSVHFGKLICKNTDGSDKEYDLSITSAGMIGFEMEDLGNNGYVYTEDSVQAPGVWLLAAATFRNADLEVRFYGDGTEIDTMASGSPIDDLPDLTAADVELGRRHYDGVGYLDGVLDEVRILGTLCSAEWMETQYKSMSDGLIQYGSEQTHGVSDTWWHTSWTRRRTLSIDNGFVDTQQDSFTALVKLWDQRIDYSNTQDDGDDIRFLDADLNSQLNYEIEEWDESGTSYVWVQLDDIKASGTTDSIFMYYGNTSATDDQDADEAWEENYVAVWHFNGDFDDASGTGNHGYNRGTSDTACVIGNGRKFDGTSDYIAIPDDASLRFSTALTVEAWVNTDVQAGVNQIDAVVNKYHANNQPSYRVEIGPYGTAGSAPGVNYYNGGWDGANSPDDMALNTWYFLTGIIKPDTAEFFVDGVRKARSTGNAAFPSYTADSLGIGRSMPPDVIHWYFDGKMDEIRLAGVRRDSIWVVAQDSSMRDNLFDFGAEVEFEEDTTGRGATWWDDAWRRRVKIAFANSFMSGSVDSFPVLVKLTPGRIDYSKCRTDGKDIRFVDADNGTALPYEIEQWDEGGYSFLWVQVPNIPAGGTTDSIWLYYDNPVAEDDQDAAGVWDDGYVGVWHMGDDLSDKTGNGLDAVNYGTDDSLGLAGMASYFCKTASDSDTIVVPYDAVLDDFTDQFTINVMVKMKSNLADWRCIAGRAAGPGTDQIYTLLEDKTADTWRLSCSTATVEGTCDGPVIDYGTWELVTGTYNGSEFKFYIDGDSVDASAGSGDIAASTADFLIGAGFNSGVVNEFIDGIVDEVRLSNVARSSDWIKATDKVFRDNFLQFGPEQTHGVPETWWHTSWPRRRTLVVDNGFVSSQQDSFPALVKVWSDRISYSSMQDSGQDLRFIDADGNSQLNYEIETWNGSGTSYVWVQLDDIKTGATPDSIFMYYGNTSVTDDQDPDMVWTNGYEAVWHFTGSDTFANAFGSGYGLTNCGTVDSAGIAGRCRYFQPGQTDSMKAGCAPAGDNDTYTMSCWFRTLQDTVGDIYSEYETGENWWPINELSLNESGGDLCFYTAEDQEDGGDVIGVTYTDGGVTVEDNQWHYLAGVKASTTVHRMYWDGSKVRDTTAASPIDPVTTNSLIMGAQWFATGGQHYSGHLDEVWVSSVGRSDLWIEAQDSSMRDNLFFWRNEEYCHPHVDSVAYWSCGTEGAEDDSLAVFFNINLEFGSLPLGAGDADHAFSLVGMGFMGNATIDTPAGCPDTDFVYIHMNAGDTILSHKRSLLVLTADSVYSTFMGRCLADTDSVVTHNVFNVALDSSYQTVHQAAYDPDLDDKDTIRVFDAGYYTDTLFIDAPALSADSVVYRAGTGMTPVFKWNHADTMDHDWRGKDLLVDVRSYTEFHGFEFNGRTIAGDDTVESQIVFCDKGLFRNCAFTFAQDQLVYGTGGCLRIDSCVFEDAAQGILWRCADGGSGITDSDFRDLYGSAVLCYNAVSSEIVGNRIYDNGGSGILMRGTATNGNVIANNIIYGNGGDGVDIYDVFEGSNRNRYLNNTVTGNANGLELDSLALVRNNILYGNTGWDLRVAPGYAVYKDSLGYNLLDSAGSALGESLTTDNGNVIDGPDPLFADAAGHDYHLRVHSPCIDRGDTAAAFDDADGGRGDMGAYGGAYAVDTLMPEVLDTLSVSCSQTHQQDSLTWSPSPVSDFGFYAVYRDTVSGFVPSESTCIDSVTVQADTAESYGNGGRYYYYKVSAVDADGYGGGYFSSAGARMELKKRNDCPEAAPGDTITYTVYYDNDGPVSTGDTALMVDYLPRFTMFLDTAGCQLHTGGSLAMMWYNGVSWQWSKPVSQEAVKAICWRIAPGIGAQSDDGDDIPGADYQTTGIDTTPGFDSGWVRFTVRVR